MNKKVHRGPVYVFMAIFPSLCATVAFVINTLQYVGEHKQQAAFTLSLSDHWPMVLLTKHGGEPNRSTGLEYSSKNKTKNEHTRSLLRL